MAPGIVLLTGAIEAPHLAGRLARHRPGLAIAAAETADELERVMRRRGPGTRLIGFCTPVIVPRHLLDLAGSPAYNFHPAPPTYPGNHSASFALYDGAGLYGATAHVMTPRVDEGPIVATELFEVPAGIDLVGLETLAYEAVVRLFDRLAPLLADVTRPLPVSATIAWSGPKTTRRDFDTLATIRPGMEPAEAARRRRACGAAVRTAG